MTILNASGQDQNPATMTKETMQDTPPANMETCTAEDMKELPAEAVGGMGDAHMDATPPVAMVEMSSEQMEAFVEAGGDMSMLASLPPEMIAEIDLASLSPDEISAGTEAFVEVMTATPPGTLDEAMEAASDAAAPFGDMSGVTGDMDGVNGNMNDVSGDMSDVSGNMSDVTGDMTDV